MRHHGRLQAIEKNWSVRISAKKPLRIKCKKLIFLARKKQPRPAHPRGLQVVLANGDRLPLAQDGVIRLVKGRLEFPLSAPLTSQRGATIQLPPPFINIIHVQPAKGAVRPERDLRRLMKEHRKQDVVLLKNGDRIEGTVTALAYPGNCTVKTRSGSIEVPGRRIIAIALSTRLMAVAPRPKRHCRIVATDGARITLSSARLDGAGKILLGKSVWRVPIELPVAKIAVMTFHHERIVYLSNVKPAKYSHRPFFGLRSPFARNESLTGGPLRLRGLGDFDAGLALPTGSSLTYHLKGRYRWFEATVGLDPRTGRKGSAWLRIATECGRMIYVSKKELTVKDPPLALRLDVKNARQLKLQVDYGSRGNVQGHVNWIGARLLK